MDIQQALKGVNLTLTATGTATMMSILFMSIAAVGIWGGAGAKDALQDLDYIGSGLLGILAVSGAFRTA
jgi:hypothetical protein